MALSWSLVARQRERPRHCPRQPQWLLQSREDHYPARLALGRKDPRDSRRWRQRGWRQRGWQQRGWQQRGWRQRGWRYLSARPLPQELMLPRGAQRSRA